VIRIEEPAIAVLRRCSQQIEFVVAEQALGESAGGQLAHELDHAGAVVSAVAEIADEDQATALRMFTVVAIAEHSQQIAQGGELAVDVTDDIQRAVEQWLKQVIGSGHVWLLSHHTQRIVQGGLSSESGNALTGLMAVRRILEMGHPLLRQVARPLATDELASEAIARLVGDMTDTLRDYGGIGLAAPQIGESVRLAIIEIPGGPSRYGDLEPMALTAFVNPVIEVLDPATRGYWEGCLSVPGLRGFVERPQHVRVRYLSLGGEALTLELRGFSATVFQHEFDHLDGRLYVDRLADTRSFAFDREYERYHL
jgi:peptide deformylase